MPPILPSCHPGTDIEFAPPPMILHKKDVKGVEHSCLLRCRQNALCTLLGLRASQCCKLPVGLDCPPVCHTSPRGPLCCVRIAVAETPQLLGVEVQRCASHRWYCAKKSHAARTCSSRCLRFPGRSNPALSASSGRLRATWGGAEAYAACLAWWHASSSINALSGCRTFCSASRASPRAPAATNRDSALNPPPDPPP